MCSVEKAVVGDQLRSSRFETYICRDVIEFCDEGMFNDVNCNFRCDDHEDVR